jgi:hypothetical protein
MPLNLLDLRLRKFARNRHLGENCAQHSHRPTSLVPRHQMHACVASGSACFNLGSLVRHAAEAAQTESHGIFKRTRSC